MSHSLDAAVAAGILTDEAAFCGLSEANVAAVAAFDPAAQVLVRFRSAYADARYVMTAAEFVYALGHKSGHGAFAQPVEDIRDVLAVAK